MLPAAGPAAQGQLGPAHSERGRSRPSLACATLAHPCAAYEVDPLECPNCGAAMRIIALIDEPAVIERILKHVKAWDPGSAPIQPAGRDPPWPQGENLPLTSITSTPTVPDHRQF